MLIILFVVCPVSFAQTLSYTLIDTEGVIHTEKTHPEKYLIVNYFATWCAPCLKEIPILADYQRQHLDRVVVFGLNHENISAERLATFAQSFAINYPIFPYVAENDFDQFEPLRYLPTTLIYDKNGVLLKTFLGEVKSEQLNATINAL